MEYSSENSIKELKNQWNRQTEELPRTLVGLIFIIAAAVVVSIVSFASSLLALFSLAISSVFAFFTSVTGFISKNYFEASLLKQQTLTIYPNWDYVAGFIVGSALLSMYIYFAYFYSSRDRKDMSTWFFGSIFAGTGTMSFGRLVQFYWSNSVVTTIQNSIIDLINAFSVFIVILLFKTMTEATEIETSFEDVLDTATMEEDKREKKKKEMNQDIAEKNPLVKFFVILISNPLWILTGLIVIVSMAYSTFLLEENLQSIMDPNWVYYIVLILLLSFLNSARKGRKSK